MKKVVAGEHLKDAITAYSDEVVKRGAEEVLISKQTTLMMLNYDQLMNSPIVTKSLGKWGLGLAENIYIVEQWSAIFVL